ncbi:MAG: TIR domain-containing protein [Oscillospiraceae bacterium]
MAIIKCKMCGGDLVLTAGSTVAECEYCGTRQTVPVADNEKKLNLFASANKLRAACEFDRAAGVYDAIKAEFPSEAESYWGAVLCKYGIEYVDDAATGRKIPTCHRSSFDSILEDADFAQAMENADAVARRVYREEAKQIEELRKDIIAVSANEQPYDIFICYKETDENSQRTLDSVMAQDLYNALTDKGYRVFFSRISLQSKLGQAYEPFIFAALNSAKVMLAVGTDPEYYNAVWVKNEWSRYLKLVAKDRNKYLIPCYKDMDAYDMPKEFRPLQGVDLGKMGAVQDILFNMEKYIPLNKPSAVREKPQAQTIWEEPKARKAHPEKKSKGKSGTAKKYAVITGLCLAVFAVAVLVMQTVSPVKRYEKAEKLLQSGEYAQAAAAFEALGDYWDSADRMRECEMGIRMEDYAEAEKLLSAGHYQEAIAAFEALGDYQDASTRIEQARYAEVEELRAKGQFVEAAAAYENLGDHEEAQYTRVEAMLSEGKTAKAAMAFYAMGDYKDARARSMEVWSQVTTRETISASRHTAALTENGRVVAVGESEDGKCNVSSWQNIVAVSVGPRHTVALKSNGTVVAVGSDDLGMCDVSGWQDIVNISAGNDYTVGLKADGTIVFTGWGGYSQDEVTAWENIVDISAGGGHVVGLMANGTVVAIGRNQAGQCDVSGWEDVVAISAGNENTVGLKADGTVLVAGDDYYHQHEAAGWRDIVAVSAGNGNVVGLKSDGSVVAAGRNLDDGQGEVSGWQNIVAVSAKYYHTVGLRADGTAIATGWNPYGQCDVYGWRNLDIPE